MTLRLRAVLDECGRHVRYMNYARSRLPRPVIGEYFVKSDDAFVAAHDQFAFRFIRLQDAFGRGAMRLLLVEVFQEPYEDAPFRDVLDRLERLGVIPAAERWEAGRAIRNMFTHDYPETPEAKVVRLGPPGQPAGSLEG